MTYQFDGISVRHLPRTLAGAYQHVKDVSSASILGEVKKLVSECRSIARKAKSERQWSQAVAALREVRGCLDLLARLEHESGHQQSTTSVPTTEETYGFKSVRDMTREELIERTVAARKQTRKIQWEMDRLLGPEMVEEIETQLKNYDPDAPIDAR